MSQFAHVCSTLTVLARYSLGGVAEFSFGRRRSGGIFVAVAPTAIGIHLDAIPDEPICRFLGGHERGIGVCAREFSGGRSW
jgi:hypothetical protein